MRITRVRTFILHVPVTRDGIADSMHQLTHWGAPGVLIDTDAGISGCGYTGTHAHRPTDRLIADCVSETYAPLLTGKDPRDVEGHWKALHHFPPAQWVGRSGITQLALAAVDIALWDIRARAAGLPLWKLLEGTAVRGASGDKPEGLEAYNTDGGWLNWPLDVLVADSRRLVEEEGYRGVKIKVGSPELRSDLERIGAVRKAVGPRVKLMVDANGRFDLSAAMEIGKRLRDYDVHWFEEPMWYDDVEGHAALARAIETPIALGEQLYTVDDFRNFIRAGAVRFVQADAVRLGGITPWWRAADLALEHGLPVAAHIGDMMQVHLHLSLAHPACRILEYIPWLRGCFEEPATVKDGWFVRPRAPGAGTALRPEALERYNVL